MSGCGSPLVTKLPYVKDLKDIVRFPTGENNGTSRTICSLLEGLQNTSAANDPLSANIIFPVDMLTCDDESFDEYLLSIREAVQRTEPKMKPKKRKPVNRNEQVSLDEDIRNHLRCLSQAIFILSLHMDEIDERLHTLSQRELILLQYYADLDGSLERGEAAHLPPATPFHRRRRQQRRERLRQRDAGERERLDGRQAQLQRARAELRDRERDLAPPDAADRFDNFGAAQSSAGAAAAGGGGDGSGFLDEGKFADDVFEGAQGKKNSPEVQLLLRALRPLWRRVQAARMEPPLPPRMVESWLRKDLILPFSARVLALKVDEAGNAGDRFVEWYVNIILDPLAMSQLVELMPREYLVTTTVRLANACDMCVQLRQSQALPDISHIVLQAIAEGRADALASLVLSPSASFLRALEVEEHTTIIFFAAILTGQMEVLRRIMSVGFYNIKALLVWLFLNPNENDPFYKDFVNQTLVNVHNFVAHENSSSCLDTSGTQQADFSESVSPKYTYTSGGASHSFFDGLVETLRQFLLDHAAMRNERMRSSPRKKKRDDVPQGIAQASKESLKISTSKENAMTPLSKDSFVSFSKMLVNRRFDRLLFSQAKCAVLPVVSTFWMRRIDPWGYIPLEGTTEYLLLLGDTSTINAHVVRMPPEYATGWEESSVDRNSARESSRRSHEIRGLKSNTSPKKPAENSNLRGHKNQEMDRSFYYEAHISIPFLVSDVPVNAESFEKVLSKGDECPPLQETSVYVGWCSEDKVPTADGKTVGPPLGSDTQSIGISFDVLYRGQSESGGERIILRPMRHGKGQSTPIFVKDKPCHDEADSTSTPVKKSTLLEVRIDDFALAGKSSVGSLGRKGGALFSQTFTLPTPRLNFTSKKDRFIPKVQSYDDEIGTLEGSSPFGEGSGATHSGTDIFQSTVVVEGLSLYGSLVLSVGCQVNLKTQCASFVVNGKNLGEVFSFLPSPVALRPAISLRASEKAVATLQKNNPVDSAVVRFAFSSEMISDRPSIASSSAPNTRSSRRGSSFFSPAVDKPRTRKFSRSSAIPYMDHSTPLLFDDVMMQCAFIRLLTQAENSPESGVDEILSGADAIALGRSVMGVTACRVRGLLNTPTNLESILFFPPVYVRRRIDDVDKESIGVTIIPADASLAPLCASLSLRHRIAAYHIAVHPLTDFHSPDEMSVRQRRMAILAAATLGYEEVLYVLLERMSIIEVLALFTIKRTENETVVSTPSTREPVSGTVNRVFSNAASMKHIFRHLSLVHRVEYTPLHCALLEGHERCVHLLLFYLDKSLLDEHKRHAVNVLTRSGETAMVMACKEGRTSIAKRLLAMGASPSSFDRVSRANCLELACASRSEEIAVALLETPDYRISSAVNHVGNASPLCWCALNNIGSLIKQLLQNGANPDIALEGPTPLILAVTFGAVDAALQLLEWCEPVVSDLISPSDSVVPKSSETTLENSKHPVQGTCFTISATSKQFFGYIHVNAVDPRSQCTALHIACELGQLEVVRALMEKGASLDLQNKSNFVNPLQMAIMNGHENLALEILEYAKDKLRRGFNVLDIAAIDKHGNTALHLAASEGMLPVIEYIMSKFSDDEITRLCNLRKFAKRPNSVSVTASNRADRTPLLMAIYAHMEEAAQLIVSLMPSVLSNPGGAVINGTCMALLASESEGLDNVTLFLLSHSSYAATSEFREKFFARYNAQRMRLDHQEDFSEQETPFKDGTNPHMHIYDVSAMRGIMRQHKKMSPRNRCKTDLRGGLVSRTSITLAASNCGNSLSAIRQNVTTNRSKVLRHPTTANSAMRRRSSFVQMLLAKSGTVPSTRKAIHCLLRGFAVEELYAMLDVIITETSRAAQSRGAMQYAELIIGFLTDHSGIYVASRDALSFARKMHTMPMLAEAVNSAELAEAKKKLSGMRPFCSEIFTIVRTRGHQETCIDDMRHLIEQRGHSGSSLTRDLTSPFGFTILQLAASLELPEVTDFLLRECRMDALYVSPSCQDIRKPFIFSTLTDDRGRTSSKWLLTPFRLALISRDPATLDMFLPDDIADEAVSELLEFRESPLADHFQQTALQEVLRQPLDSDSEGNESATIRIARLLLRQGAVVQGNPDAEGNDAWMLAVRSSYGSGRILELFLEENVEMDDESDDEEASDRFNAYDKEKNVRRSDTLRPETVLLQQNPSRLSGSQSQGSESENSNVGISTNVMTVKLPTFSRIPRSSYLSNSFNRRDDVFVCDRSAWNAQILFLCAEHNPCHLISLLERYAAILSPSAVHPHSGETLLIYILGKAVNLYESTGNTANIVGSARHEQPTFMETELKTLHNVSFGLDKSTNSSRENECEDVNEPYRDPLTIPAVLTLINVVEQMLKSFYFSNLHQQRGDGETALSLAARLSNTNIVSLIVRPVHTSTCDKSITLTPSVDVDSAYGGLKDYVGNINPDLTESLLLKDCLSNISTRLYYPEDELETILTISKHIPDADKRFTFLSIVYSNLHPILALRVASHFSSHAKKILMRAEAANAFWCNVLYAQYTGRLDDVPMKSLQWNSILSVLLPVAPAVALYLIKAVPMPADVRSKRPSEEQSPVPAPSRRGGRKKDNWSEILRCTEAYFCQLSIASSTVLVLNTPNQQPIPTAQRQAFASMSGLFHEIIELAVRFDNTSLLTNLITNSEQLKDHLKLEYRYLMEIHHLDVIAIAAGSINVLKLLSGIPEASSYIRCGRYDRIHPITGIPEDLRRIEASVGDSVDTVSLTSRRRSADKTLNSIPRIQNNASPSVVSNSGRGAMIPPESPSQIIGRRPKGVATSTVSAESADTAYAQDATKGEDDTFSETVMQYMEVLTAARERTAPSAVTWGVGAAARPVALQKGKEKEINRVQLETSHLITVTAPGSRGKTAIHFSEGNRSPSVHRGPSAKGEKDPSEIRSPSPSDSRSTFAKLLKAGSLPSLRTIGNPKRSGTKASDSPEATRSGGVMSNVAAPEPPIRYFAHYLCDWALHSTLVLHAARPSLKTIDTVLYLLDFRALLTLSVLKIFFAASRPLTNWVSSSGEQLAFTYTTRTHEDTLLHLLVQQDQLQLTQYFLATALFYFTRYQYDPPSVMPPKFLLMNFDVKPPAKGQGGESRQFDTLQNDKTKKCDPQNSDEEDDLSYPTVFLRCMLRTNKYGLTPFDYARGPLVSLLMEYGCVPPSYRPNPSGFCSSVRLPPAKSSPPWHAFHPVPRLLLVSKSLVGLRDDVRQSRPVSASPAMGESPAHAADGRIPDATIARNQAASQRATRAAGLEELPTDDVSRLHLGLCSVNDELVLQKIAMKRKKQLTLLASGGGEEYKFPSVMPPDVPDRLPSASQQKNPGSPGKTKAKRQRGSKGSSSRQNEKEPPTALGLLHALRDRGFVAFPLVLPINEVGDSVRHNDAEHNETAILISMTPMMLAQFAGAVKRDESTAHSSHNKKSTLAPIPPRFVATEKTPSSAELLEAWILTRRVKASGKDPNMQLLVKSLNSGVVGQNVRSLSLIGAPSYEPKR